MKSLRQSIRALLLWVTAWLQSSVEWVRQVFTAPGAWLLAPDVAGNNRHDDESEPWQTDAAHRTYTCGDGSVAMVTVQTSTHAFHVDLARLSECSDYFRALSQSSMKETAESLVHLEHIPSPLFRNLLEFCFCHRFVVPDDELGVHVEVGSYLLATAFTSRCLSALSAVLTRDNCTAYLRLARDICCGELRATVMRYLAAHLLELPHLTMSMAPGERDELLGLRERGRRRLCSVRKENLTPGTDPETSAARRLFSLEEEDGGWRSRAQLPFTADKWCFTTAVLFNYLYLIGGYRQRAKKGYEFKMTSFRYNPFTHQWASTAPLIKHRRHFSAAVCEGLVFAVGGWYLDSLVSPDSSTAVYTAVERYDPWEDTWSFVSSLPLTDFLFTMSLSHDVPLVASLGHCLYVVGNIQRTGEKLVLQYDIRQDSWSELLPTLTRADADIPSLYFLGATDRLFVIGGNNVANVVTTFCVEARRWGRAREVEKLALAGQGAVLGEHVYMAGIERSSVVRLDLNSLSLSVLPPLPIPTRYEALVHLYF